MKNICIETKSNSAIGWWIRYSWEEELFTTFNWNTSDTLRIANCNRFGKKIVPLSHKEMANVLLDDNNIQIVTNDWTHWIDWMYKTPKNHPLLSKTGIISLLKQYPTLYSYIPKSYISHFHNFDPIFVRESIISNFSIWSKLILKDSKIDWNWNWVFVIEYNWNIEKLDKDIRIALFKFNYYYKVGYQNNQRYEIVIQEFIESCENEWSVTFSIQNNRIENRWLVNNVTKNWEYFCSSNYIPFLDNTEWKIIEQKIESDLQPLLKALQQEWIRGNIWFDLLFKKEANKIQTYILECNWIHRTTWSTLPNSFAFNTKNKLFLWMPLSTKKLKPELNNIHYQDLTHLAKYFESKGNTLRQPQVINIKYEWLERGIPTIRLSVVWNTISDIKDVFDSLNITSIEWGKYIQQNLNKALFDNNY